MYNQGHIVHITNFTSREIKDGGINREEALSKFLANRGATRLVIQDDKFKHSKFSRLTRILRLLSEIRSLSPDTIILNYPAYPFFWQHKITLYTLQAQYFARWLRKWSLQNKARIIIDIADLPLYQYEDLGLPMEMSTTRFKQLDKTLFLNADELWVCSHSLSILAREAYGLDKQIIKPVVNGSVARNQLKSDSGAHPFRFVYCGGLKRHRYIDNMIQTFIDSNISNAELHLAGTEGQWIPSQFPQNNVIYHGSLTDAAAAKMAMNCDLGLIYYPQKGYYHLAFATKLAFYICCGLPVLCTDVNETGNAIRSMGVGQIVDIANFGEAMKEIAGSADLRTRFRDALAAAGNELTWERIYSVATGEISMKSGYPTPEVKAL